MLSLCVTHTLSLFLSLLLFSISHTHSVSVTFSHAQGSRGSTQGAISDHIHVKPKCVRACVRMCVCVCVCVCVFLRWYV
jgi:hypothetical protein